MIVTAHASVPLEAALLALPAGLVLVSIVRSLRGPRDPSSDISTEEVMR